MPSQHPARTEPTLRYLLCTNPGGWHRMGYWEWGDERNEDVLLCMHGLTRNGRDFDAVARRFSHKYRVICPDMAGRGTSDWLEEPDFYTFAQYVGDLASLIARLQPARITWLGTSMGGLIGLTFIYMLSQTAKTPLGGGRCNAAAQDWLIQKTNPFDRLILNDIGPELALEGMKNIARYVEAGQSFATHDEALAYARTHWSGFGLQTPEQWDSYTRHYFVTNMKSQWVPHYDPAIMRAFVRGLNYPMDESQTFLWSVIQQLQIPLLILRGSHSDLLTAEVYQRMLDEQPLAQGWQTDRAGHAPSLLHDDELDVIEGFLNS